MRIQRWSHTISGDLIEDAVGDWMEYADHVDALDAAVSDARARAYTLMGAAIQNGIDAERQRIRFAVGALPLDNSGRVDYADTLAAINEEDTP